MYEVALRNVVQGALGSRRVVLVKRPQHPDGKYYDGCILQEVQNQKLDEYVGGEEVSEIRRRGKVSKSDSLVKFSAKEVLEGESNLLAMQRNHWGEMGPCTTANDVDLFTQST